MRLLLFGQVVGEDKRRGHFSIELFEESDGVFGLGGGEYVDFYVVQNEVVHDYLCISIATLINSAFWKIFFLI